MVRPPQLLGLGFQELPDRFNLLQIYITRSDKVTGNCRYRSIEHSGDYAGYLTFDHLITRACRFVEVYQPNLTTFEKALFLKELLDAIYERGFKDGRIEKTKTIRSFFKKELGIGYDF